MSNWMPELMFVAIVFIVATLVSTLFITDRLHEQAMAEAGCAQVQVGHRIVWDCSGETR